MRYLDTVYVSSYRTKISRSKRYLVINIEGEKTRVPLSSIDGVVVVGGASMTMDAVASCVENGVRVAVLKRNGALRWSANPPTSGNVELRRRQHHSSEDPEFRLRLCQNLVAGKLQNSARVASRWERDSDPLVRQVVRPRVELIHRRIERLPSAESDNHVRGIEGDAARAHFACMGTVLQSAGWHFGKRNRRPPRDPVNALLSFGYGLLTTEITGALNAVGLDPQFGYLHRDRPGRPGLALDILEEFRALNDRFVVRSLKRRQINADDFVVTPGGGTYLSDDGRSKYFRLWEAHKNEAVSHRVLNRQVERWALPGVQATLMARHIRGDIPVYPPFVLQN